MEKKNNNIIVVVLSVVVLVLFVLFGGYVLVDQGVIKLNSGKEQVEDNNKENNKVQLDINSRLVRSLYYMVADDSSSESWSLYWRYQSGSFVNLEDFNINSSESIKMQLVAKNLLDSQLMYNYDCSSLSIPNTNSIGGHSICYSNSLYNSGGQQSYYKREYVETVYKKIFGQNAKLDTSVDIRMDHFGGVVYSYVSSKDAYYKYIVATGGASGPGGYTSVLASAEKDGNKLYIYEDVNLETYDGANKNAPQKFKMIYTFKLEEDGMYSFISRIKKSVN